MPSSWQSRSAVTASKPPFPFGASVPLSAMLGVESKEPQLVRHMDGDSSLPSPFWEFLFHVKHLGSILKESASWVSHFLSEEDTLTSLWRSDGNWELPGSLLCKKVKEPPVNRLWWDPPLYTPQVARLQSYSGDVFTPKPSTVVGTAWTWASWGWKPICPSAAWKWDPHLRFYHRDLMSRNSSLGVLGCQRSLLLDPYLSFQWFFPAICMQFCQSPLILMCRELLENITGRG